MELSSKAAVQIKRNIMKNTLYVIAGLLVVIWGIIFLGFHTHGPVHILLVVAGFIVLGRLLFAKQLSKN